MALRLGRVVTQVKWIPPTESSDHVTPEKLKNLYLHFQKTYGNQTCHGGDLGWGTWPFHF